MATVGKVAGRKKACFEDHPTDYFMAKTKVERSIGSPYSHSRLYNNYEVAKDEEIRNSGRPL